MKFPKMKQGSGPKPSGTPHRVPLNPSRSKKSVNSSAGMHKPTARVK